MKIILLALTCLVGCIGAKESLKPIPGEPFVCTAFRDCMNWNEKNPDKSICTSLALACAKASETWQKKDYFVECKTLAEKHDYIEYKECIDAIY